MKKRTLICIHVMPTEIEMFERLMIQMRKALQYLDSNDSYKTGTQNLQTK